MVTLLHTCSRNVRAAWAVRMARALPGATLMLPSVHQALKILIPWCLGDRGAGSNRRASGRVCGATGLVRGTLGTNMLGGSVLVELTIVWSL